MVTIRSAALATVALLTGAAQAGAPAYLQDSYSDGGLWRYRVGCDAYRGNYCQDFVHALNTVACNSFQHNWQAYEDSNGRFIFDVSVVAGIAGADAIACAINTVTGQGAYRDGACLVCDNEGGCQPNGIDLTTCRD